MTTRNGCVTTYGCTMLRLLSEFQSCALCSAARNMLEKFHAITFFWPSSLYVGHTWLPDSPSGLNLKMFSWLPRLLMSWSLDLQCLPAASQWSWLGFGELLPRVLSPCGHWWSFVGFGLQSCSTTFSASSLLFSLRFSSSGTPKWSWPSSSSMNTSLGLSCFTLTLSSSSCGYSHWWEITDWLTDWLIDIAKTLDI